MLLSPSRRDTRKRPSMRCEGPSHRLCREATATHKIRVLQSSGPWQKRITDHYSKFLLSIRLSSLSWNLRWDLTRTQNWLTVQFEMANSNIPWRLLTMLSVSSCHWLTSPSFFLHFTLGQFFDRTSSDDQQLYSHVCSGSHHGLSCWGSHHTIKLGVPSGARWRRQFPG